MHHFEMLKQGVWSGLYTYMQIIYCTTHGFDMLTYGYTVKYYTLWQWFPAMVELVLQSEGVDNWCCERNSQWTIQNRYQTSYVPKQQSHIFCWVYRMGLLLQSSAWFGKHPPISTHQWYWSINPVLHCTSLGVDTQQRINCNLMRGLLYNTFVGLQGLFADWALVLAKTQHYEEHTSVSE